MTDLTLGTFNVENLFLRYTQLAPKDRKGNPKPVDPEKLTALSYTRALQDASPVGDALRSWTAKVILENAPDVLAVQEVESLEALDKFNRDFLKNAYPYLILIDGNDARLIDVGLLSKFDFTAIRTHRFEPKGAAPTRRIFARDCLEVELAPAPGKTLRLYINHLTSKLPKKDKKTGKITHGEDRRRGQATRLAGILRDRHGPDLHGNFAVLGDFNAGPREPELQPLLGLGLDNVVARLPDASERWTHFYSGAPKGQRPVEQLDYVLLSPDLAAANRTALPTVERRGLPDKAVKKINAAGGVYGAPIRNSWTVGKKGEASDHCGVFIRLNLP